MKKTILVMILLALTVGNVYTTLAQEAKPASDSTDIVHPIPEVPIILDGTKMAPEEIAKFNGRELYYLVNEQAKSNGVVYVFTTLDGIRSFAENANSQAFQQRMADCNIFSRFYKNTSYGGSGELGLTASGVVFNLNGSASSWNNEMESVKTTSYNVYTKLADGFNLSGSQLWLATCGDTPNLGIYGWNNRASSIKVESP